MSRSRFSFRLLLLGALLGGTLSARAADEIVTAYFQGWGASRSSSEPGYYSISIYEGQIAANPAVPLRTVITENRQAATSGGYLQGGFYLPWRDLRMEVGRIYHLTIVMDGYMDPITVHPLFKTPPGYHIDRSIARPYLRTESGDAVAASIPLAARFDDGDRVLRWDVAGDAVKITVNYLVPIRFLRDGGPGAQR